MSRNPGKTQAGSQEVSIVVPSKSEWKGLKSIQVTMSELGTAQFKLQHQRKVIWERKCQREKAG